MYINVKHAECRVWKFTCFDIVTLNGLYGLKPFNFPELKIYGRSETYIKYVRTLICVI